jgi:hypothetical protein
MKTAVMLALITTLALIDARPTSGQAQINGEGESLSCKCNSFQNFYGTWVHDFRSTGDLAYECTDDCHSSAVMGLCSSQHPGCGGGLAGTPTEAETRLAVRSTEGLSNLLARKNVIYNRDRQLVQVLSCDARTVAFSIRVRSTLHAAAERTALRS